MKTLVTKITFANVESVWDYYTGKYDQAEQGWA